MKKILIAVLALFLVLLGVVLVVPALIDWNAYKDEIAARVGAATGRTVTIAGDIRMTLLPAPALSVRDARVSGPPGASQPDMARVRELDVRVALPPLLSGHVEVESITLVEPTLVFEVLPDGRTNWDMAPDPAAAPRGTDSGGGLGGAVSFDQVSVRDGTILYHDAQGGHDERVEAVDARIVAGSVAGPFQVQGTFRARGVALRGELTTGRFTEGASVPLRATLALPDTDAALRFAGIIAPTAKPANTRTANAKPSNGGPRVQGDLRAEGGDLAGVLATLRGGGGVPAALAQPFSLRASIEASAAGAGLAGVEAQVGDTRANGSATLRAGTPAVADVKLVVNRIDLDAWLRRGPAGKAPPAAGRGAGPAGTAPSPAGAGDFTLPAGVDGHVDLLVDAVTYNGGTVRQARVEAALADGRLNLDRVSALLPGGTDAVATGALTAAAGQPSLDLRLAATADDLRTLLGWLAVDVRAVPGDRLHKAALNARVQARPGRIDVTGIDLGVDTSHATGGIAYADRGRPAFGVRLDIDHLDLDAYRPAAAAGSTAAHATAGTGEGPVPPALARLLAAVDGTINLGVGDLAVNGLTAQGVRLDASAAHGAVTLREARVADLAGVTARATGQVGALAPIRNAHLELEASAQSLAGVQRLVRWPADAPAPERIGAVTATGRLAGDLDTLAVEATATAAGGTVEAGGTLTNLQGTVKSAIKVRASHPELARLAALFDQPRAPLGPLDLYTEVEASGKAVALNAIQGTVAGTVVAGKAGIDLAQAKPRIQAEVRTGDIDADRLLAPPAAASKGTASKAGTAGAGEVGGGGGDALDFGWLRSFDGTLALTSSAILAGGVRLENPALRAGVTDGVLTLDQFDGGLLGGQVGATGRLAAPANGAPAADLSVTVVKARLAKALADAPLGGDLPLDVTGGTLDFDAELHTIGSGKRAMLEALSGKGRMAGRDGTVRGFDLGALRDRLTHIERPQDALEAVLRGVQGGETHFSRLDGTFAVERGTVTTNDLRLISEVGEATGVGTVGLPARTIDLRVRLQVQGDVPPLAVRLSGPLAQPTRSFEMQEVQAYIARKAAAGLLKQAVPDLPVPAPGGAKPRDMLRGLIEGLRR